MGLKLVIDKSVMLNPPPWVEKTIIGFPMGSISQYRGKNGLHIREYEDRFELHIDAFDPRYHPFLHLALEFVPTVIRSII
ncbi:MAG: hypothetical protein QXH39_06285 [Conexivisphaerales archaeon]